MEKATAIAKIRLNVKCPICGVNIDLLHEEKEGSYSPLIDHPYEAKGQEVICFNCCEEFELDSVAFL